MCYVYIYTVGWILGSSVLCPTSKYEGGGWRKSSVFFKGDSLKGDHPLSSAGRWSLLFKCESCFMVHLAPDMLVVFDISFSCSSLYFQRCFYHILGLSSKLASVYYLLLSRHVWRFSNADLLILIRVADGGVAIVVIMATPCSTQKYQPFLVLQLSVVVPLMLQWS